MGRKKLVESAPAEEVVKSEQVEEAKNEAKVEDSVEVKEEKKTKALAERVLLDTRGKFQLFRVGEGFELVTTLGVLSCKGDDLDEGRRIFAGMTRQP